MSMKASSKTWKGPLGSFMIQDQIFASSFPIHDCEFNLKLEDVVTT